LSRAIPLSIKLSKHVGMGVYNSRLVSEAIDGLDKIGRDIKAGY